MSFTRFYRFGRSSLGLLGIWAGVTAQTAVASTQVEVLPEDGASSQLAQWFNAHFGSPSRLARVRSKFSGFNHEENRLDPLKVHRARIGKRDFRSVRFQHFFHGLEVIGSQVIESSGTRGSDVVDALAQFDLDPNPRLSQAQAIEAALAVVPGGRMGSAGPMLKVLPDRERGGGLSARLIYDVPVMGGGSFDGYSVWLDAHSGQILSATPNHFEIAPPAIDVHSAADDSREPLSCRPLAPGSPGPEVCAPNYQSRDQVTAFPKVVDSGVANASADAQARRALLNAKKAVQYYASKFGRNSFDGQGQRVVNVVHAGKLFANAFWSPVLQIMGYGDGDGVQLGDMTLSSDVAGHELTHAVVSHTAGLRGEGMPGALNEAIADLFGEAIEGRYDWLMGPDVMVKPADRLTGIRNLANPSALTFSYRDASGQRLSAAYPAKMSEYRDFRGADGNCVFDRCGIHINATIIGHTGFRMHKTIGPDAEKIWYLTLTSYLTALSTFDDFATGTRAACEQLFGAASTQCRATVRILQDQGFNLPDLVPEAVRVLKLR